MATFTSAVQSAALSAPLPLLEDLQLPIEPRCDQTWKGPLPYIEVRARNWSDEISFPNMISLHCAACVCKVSTKTIDQARKVSKDYFSRVKYLGFGFIRQTRVGLNGKPIKVKKIRSMKDTPLSRRAVKMHTRTKGGKNPRDPSITRFGLFIRTFHIDELPQIRDVLKGKLKLVGVRPYMSVEFLLLPYAVQKKLISHTPGLVNILHLRNLRSGKMQEENRAITAYLKVFENSGNPALFNLKCLAGILRQKTIRLLKKSV